MTTIAENITRIQQAKTNIKAAIEEKGVEVGQGTIDTYAEKIAQIPSGGSGVDWSELGYSQEPTTISDGYTYAKTIKDNWDPNLSSYSSQFSYDNNLIYLPNLKINAAKNTSKFCQWCTSLEFCDELDFATSDTYAYMFSGCTALKTAPKINGRPTTMNNMFYECHYIKDVPIYDTSLTTNFGMMFYQSGGNLTDQSLDNVLQMCINATSYTGTKTLSTMSFVNNRVPATRWQNQPHYQEFLDAGWTIGYE